MIFGKKDLINMKKFKLKKRVKILTKRLILDSVYSSIWAPISMKTSILDLVEDRLGKDLIWNLTNDFHEMFKRKKKHEKV